MRVFISHASRDDAQVTALATFLRGRGIDVWLDHWEMVAGDDLTTSTAGWRMRMPG